MSFLRNLVLFSALVGLLASALASQQPASEGSQQVERLLARGAPVRRRPIVAEEIGGLGECLTPDGDLRTFPCHLAETEGLDGFYAARLVRAE